MHPVEIVHLAPSAAHQRLREGALYLDVRTPEEFEEGHPEGAWNLPVRLRSPERGLVDNPAFVADALACLPPDRVLVIGCRAGPRAEQAAALLAATRTAPLYVMDGGMEGRRDAFGALEVPGWKQAGLPIAYDAAASYEALRARATGHTSE